MGVSAVNVDVGQVLSGAGQFIKDIRTAITGKEPLSQEKIAELELRAKELDQNIVQGQLAINLAEAQSGNWFVAGWRPAIGWVGAIALGYQYLVQPMLLNILSAFDIAIVIKNPDFGDLISLVLVLLGASGLRTLEKVKGAA